MEDSFSELDTPYKTVQIGKTQIPPPAATQFSTMLSSATFINHNLDNLESRVNTCNSVYKLATETNDIRQKEQTQHLNNVQDFLANLENRISHIETYLRELPGRVREEATKSIQMHSNYNELKLLVDAMDKEMNDRFDTLESIIQENDKIMNKTYKKIRNEMDNLSVSKTSVIKVDEFEGQLNNIEQKNRQMRTMVDSLRDSLAFPK